MMWKGVEFPRKRRFFQISPVVHVINQIKTQSPSEAEESVACNMCKPEVYTEIMESLGDSCGIDAFNRNPLATTCPIQLQDEEFFQHDFKDKMVWIHPPQKIIADALHHYTMTKVKNPQTSAVFVLPSTMGKLKPWVKYLKGMQLIKQYIGRDRIYCTTTMDKCTTSKNTEIWYDPPGHKPDLSTQQKVLNHVKTSKTTLKMVFQGLVQGQSTLVLVDSGASNSFITADLASKAGLHVTNSHDNIQVAGETSMDVTGTAEMRLRIGTYIGTQKVLVVKKLIAGVDLILGEDWLEATEAEVSYKKQCVMLASPKCTLYPISKGDTYTRSAEYIHYMETNQNVVMSAKQAVRALRKGSRHFLVSIKKKGDGSINSIEDLLAPMSEESARQETNDQEQGLEPSVTGKGLVFPSDGEHLQEYTNHSNHTCQSMSQNQQGSVHNRTEKKAVFTATGKEKRKREELGQPPQQEEALPLPPPIETLSIDDAIENKLLESAECPTLVPRHIMRQTLQESKVLFKILDKVEDIDRGIGHTIKLDADTVPPYRPCRRMSPAELEMCKLYVAELLKKGFITPSTSPFGAPIMFVAKPGGGFRVVCDWRALNKKTIKNKYPIPRIDETIDKLNGSTIFSSLDLDSGYFQIKISEEDAHKTAFTTLMGHYEFKVLGMGLANSPATFQAVMNRVFHKYLNTFVVIYLDDIMIYSKTPEEHVEHIKLVFEVLEKEKLHVKLSKCSFNMKEVKFLGHIVGRDGIKVNPAKISAVTKWPIPKDVKQLRQFLGLTNYFRKFIQGYSSLTAPLHELTRKGTDFGTHWSANHTELFEKLKEALVTAPVLVLPDFEKPFTVVSDASLLGTGAVLLQDGRPVAYTSKKFNSAEKNYTTTEQELLGAVSALKEWRCYTEGSKDLKVVTDHHPLKFLASQPILSRRLARWEQELMGFDFTWIYEAGRTNMADPLSRSPALTSLVVACMVCASSRTTDWMTQIKAGYSKDPTFLHPKKTWSTDKGFYFSKGKIIVPQVGSLRTDIMREMHTPKYAGHMGRDKTEDMLRRTFFWPNLSADVKVFIQSCHQCQINKPSNQKPGGLFTPVEIPKNFFECITTDLITKLPPTKNGRDAIAVFVDKLSKVCIAEPCQTDINAEDYANLFLKAVFRYHGLPEKIITDRDARFTGKFLKQIASVLDIRQAFSTSFHPQTDGQTEIMNRNLEDVLRHYVSPYHDDWDEHLFTAEFAINNSKNGTIGMSPFMALYGRQPLTPIHLAVKAKLSGYVPKADLFLTQYTDRLEYAKKCVSQAQERQATQANKKRRDVTYEVGQEVLSTKNLKFKATGCPKFAPKFTGPYKVIQLVGKRTPGSTNVDVVTAVKLELPPLMRVHPVFHVSLVKPYAPSSTYVPPQPLEYDTDGSPLWEVGCILDMKTIPQKKRKGRGQPKPVNKFLVRWKGFGDDQDSWEPEQNVKHLQAYHEYMAKPTNVATRRVPSKKKKVTFK